MLIHFSDSSYTVAVITGTFMEDKTAKITCELQGCVSEKLKLVHRWIDELEGSNRYKAFELMKLVTSGEIMSEEALVMLDCKHD